MSTLRLFFVIALCGVATAGKLPAVLHVASVANASASGESSSPLHLSTTCSCGHHHGPTEEDSSNESQEHDHRNCRVCQSVFTVFTVAEFQIELVSAAFLQHNVPMQPQCAASSTDILVPDSRGSPSLNLA